MSGFATQRPILPFAGSDDPEGRLTVLIEGLERGQTLHEAARTAGIRMEHAFQLLDHMRTVGEDAEVLESRIQRRLQLRLVGLAHRSVDVIQEAIVGGDPKIAIQLLNSLGILRAVGESVAQEDAPAPAVARDEDDQAFRIG